MSINWTASGDFSSIVDDQQSLTLLRRGRSLEVSIAGALRSEHLVSELEPSGGNVASANAVWDFELPLGEPAPQLGDMLIDSVEGHWTILVVEALRGSARYRCQTRDLAICLNLRERVSIEQAVWLDSGQGPEIVSWTTVRSAVPARLQPVSVDVDNTVSPASSKAAYRAFLGEPYELDHNYRLVDASGARYAIDRYSHAEQIDKVPVADVIRLE